MSDAAFTVSYAGPLVTYQDAGRPGNMRFGVAASGPMDRLAFDAAHAALGNTFQRSLTNPPKGQTAIEISLGGLILQCKHGTVSVSITGGDFNVEHNGQKFSSWVILTLTKGERLTIRAGKSGSWAYLAFAGNLHAKSWLGSQATHSSSGYGGGVLQAGDRLNISNAVQRDDRLGDIPRPNFSSDSQKTDPIQVVSGPQDQHFAADALTKFLSEPFKVSQAYDRMGMRLDGAKLELNEALAIPSEPIARGSVQVSGDGVPTVLLADHQTTGGYPKIATVISCDTDRLAQFRAAQTLRFTALTAQQSIEKVRNYLSEKSLYLNQIAIPRGTLEQRLMQENLNHGWHGDERQTVAPDIPL